MPAARPTELAVIITAIVADLVVWNGDRDLRAGGVLPWLVIPALVVTVHLSLFWRHRWPGAVYVAQVAFAACSAIVPEFQPFAGLLVALFEVARRWPLTRSIGGFAITLVPFLVHSVSVTDGSVVDALQLQLLWTGLTGAVWGVGRYLFVAAQRDRRLREQRAREAVEAERRRLARALHDTVSHSVVTMIMQAAGTRQLAKAPPETTSQAFEVIETYGRRAMTELHQLLGLLDPADPVAEPRVGDIATLVARARGAGRVITYAQHGRSIDIGGSAEATAYRIVQEGLTNTLKYAGPDAVVAVDLRWNAAGLRVDVLDRRVHRRPRARSVGPDRSVRPDRSVGPDRCAISSGAGLAGLRARVEAAGGSWRAEPVTDGFRLSAAFPASDPGRRRLVPRAA